MLCVGFSLRVIDGNGACAALDTRLLSAVDGFVRFIASISGLCASGISIKIVSKLNGSVLISIHEKGTVQLYEKDMLEYVTSLCVACIALHVFLLRNDSNATNFENEYVQSIGSILPNIGQDVLTDSIGFYKNNMTVISTLLAELCEFIVPLGEKHVLIIGYGESEFSIDYKMLCCISASLRNTLELSDYYEELKVYLPIKKVDLDCSSQWEFKIDEKVIKAKIHPSKRQEMRNIVCSYALGDKCLYVLLSLSAKISPSGRCLENGRRYEIKEVYGVPRAIDSIDKHLMHIKFKIDDFSDVENEGVINSTSRQMLLV